MPPLYGLDLFGLAMLSVYTMIKFVKYDSSKQPDPIQMEIKRHPCVYGHPCLESREEEVDWYLLTSKKEEDEDGEPAGEEATPEEEAPEEAAPEEAAPEEAAPEGEQAEGEEKVAEGGGESVQETVIE